jgi:hypothetical protein
MLPASHIVLERQRKEGYSESVAGFDLDVWDYVTFAAVFVLVAAGTVLVVLIAGLPGWNRDRP